LDFIFCLSPFDVELEHWLGARQVAWIPRTVTSDPIDWKPRGNRLGFVGRLDHVPNIEGLLLFLKSLSGLGGSGVRVRIVGGPDRIGRLLMKLFSTVDYLGMLPDDELREEASTWSGFINPIFCYSRGCSTKLATAISWQIPIVTTTSGRRGYTWKRGTLLVADSPDAFSSLSLSLIDLEVARKARERVVEVAQSSPSIEIVGKQIARLLAITCSDELRGADKEPAFNRSMHTQNLDGIANTNG
jgi:glycosyltransferase involved in cell wall biosynthesis